MPPPSLTKRPVNHARPNGVTEGCAADWTVSQLREAAQRIADRIESLMNGPTTDAVAAQRIVAEEVTVPHRASPSLGGRDTDVNPAAGKTGFGP